MKLPNEIYRQHITVLGKTGSGKSSALRLMVEHLLDEAKPVCIIDPKGDWYGLRLSKSGKSAGYPVVIFGGDHADVPINAHSGNHVAELIATGNRPCIIDLGGWMVSDRTRFFIDFASTLFRTTRGARYIVVDEVHNFAPQGKVLDPDAGKMLHWANRLASEGRGKGLTILSASQRPQKVHKDFLTCAETLIAMRVIHKLDRDAIKDWIDGAGDSAKGKEVLDTLAGMERGQAWVWSPEIKFGPTQVTFPMFRTYDSFAPKANDGTASLKGWASVDLGEVTAKLAKIVEEAKANDPVELRKQIAELKRQLAAKPAAAVDEKATERAVSFAVAAERKRCEGVIAEANKMIRHQHSLIDKVAKLIGASEVLPAPPQFAAPSLNGHAEKPGPIAPKVSERPAQKPLVQKTHEISAEVGDLKLNKTQQRILDALAWYESIGQRSPSNTKIGAVALVDPTGGYFSNLVGPLSSEGLIERGNGCLTLTDAGRALASPIKSAASLSEYHDTLKARVLKMKSAANKTTSVLDVIIDAGGKPITTAEIGEAIGVDHTGGYFSNLIGPLSTAGLITRSGGVVTPTDVLFPQGLY